MDTLSDADLYSRGAATLLGSWEAYAGGSTGASVKRLPGVACGVFPNEPECGVYNNALLHRGLVGAPLTDALDAMEAAYAEAEISRFAAWVHETDAASVLELERRGYTFDTSTRAMGMTLDQLPLGRPDVELGKADWEEYLRVIEAPPGLLKAADHAAFRVLVGRFRGENAAAAMAFDLNGDRGIYNVGTVEPARGHGLGTALTWLLLHDASNQGLRTASLQSTPMAERMYASAGFRDLGRFLEYVPEPPNHRGAVWLVWANKP